MSIIGLLKYAFQAISKLIGWQRDKELIKSGERKAAQKGQEELIEKAQEAKEIDSSVDSDPGERNRLLKKHRRKRKRK